MVTHKLREDAELRLLEPRHAEELFGLIDRNRERLRPWMMFVDYATSVDAERAFIISALKQFADGQGFHCGIWLDGKLVGGIGMMPIDLRERSTEIGYWLDAEAEGMGLVTASCKALLDYCFGAMNVNRIVSRTAPGNARSQAVARRLGAVHEGTQRQSVMIQGKMTDSEVFSVLKQDWPSSESRCRAFFVHQIRDDTEMGILEPVHADELFALIDRNREYLRQWLPWVDGTKTVEDTRANRKKMLHEFAENGTITAGIWHEGSLAGVIGLHSIGMKCMEIGYWLSEDQQGRGLITPACKEMIRHAFEELGVNRIEIWVEPRNHRSRAIPERLQFTYEGTMRQRGINSDGRIVDLMMFSLLKEEWKAQTNGH